MLQTWDTDSLLEVFCIHFYSNNIYFICKSFKCILANVCISNQKFCIRSEQDSKTQGQKWIAIPKIGPKLLKFDTAGEIR